NDGCSRRLQRVIRRRLPVGESNRRVLRRPLARLVLAVSVGLFVAACGAGPNAGVSSPSARSTASSTLATASSPISTSSAGQMYSNAAYGWSITLPPGWKLDDADPSDVKISTAPELPAGLVGIHSSNS